MALPSRVLNAQRSQRRSIVRSVSSPVTGWNARDSLDRMAETDAVILDNWFPSEGEVSVRSGYTSHATGLGSDVELLAEFDNGATQKFLAAAGATIYDVTAAATATNLASGFSNARWDWVNFNGRMGLVNGADNPQQFAGSAITAMTISSSAVSTVASFVGIASHNSRTYFWQENSQDFYYSAVNALGGSLTKFPLSRVGHRGGKLVNMVSWSRDGGDGMNNLAVFIMSVGE